MIRLDVVPQSIQQNQPKSGTTTGGSICLSSVSPAQTLCELETRSRSHGTRCIHPGLDEIQRLRQPTMESDKQGSNNCQEPESEGDTNCTDLDSISLVPSATGNVSSRTRPITTNPNPHHTDSQSQQTKHSTVPRLAMWVISGIDLKAKTFQRRVQNFSWPPGRLKHQSHMTPYLENGYAGAIRGIQIPFLEI